MSDEQKFPVPESIKKITHCDQSQYKEWYQASVQNPDEFWDAQAKNLEWDTPWTKVKDTSFKEDDVHIRWFEGGELNACFNCVDRHLPDRAHQTALIWEPDDPNQPNRKISYQELHDQVARLANALKSLGVKRGNCVTLYLPMIPEAIFSMLACARIGAIHSVVFGGFSARSLAERIQNSKSQYVITADEGLRGGKVIPLKKTVDEALQDCPDVKTVVLVKRTGNKVPWNSNRDVEYQDLVNQQKAQCPPEKMGAEDPLFILYTSGSTGKPKGLLHTTGGYLVYAAITHKLIFDYHDGDVYWCTADVGWITGHTYIVYGPLANGATQVIYEGVPNYPNCSRHWDIVDKHDVNIYYTAPTAIRALMREGDAPVKKTSRKSLRILGSVGEPINPEAWNWYYRTIGDSRCAIVDTWWQTETGGILISPLPGAFALKPGSATFPFFGIQPAIVNEKGEILEGECSGSLCFLDSWPGQARTIYGDHKRFFETYFSQYKGKYFSGDGCRRDQDGYYWITGRMDDVLNVSGHRLGTAEVESALVAHQDVSEAAVVGFPHDVKGEGIYAYVTPRAGLSSTQSLEKELVQWVRKQIGPIATPDKIHFTSALPKTRSGKIMRRILRKIAKGDSEHLGDTSTLSNPDIVQQLVQSAP